MTTRVCTHNSFRCLIPIEFEVKRIWNPVTDYANDPHISVNSATVLLA